MTRLMVSSARSSGKRQRRCEKKVQRRKRRRSYSSPALSAPGPSHARKSANFSCVTSLLTFKFSERLMANPVSALWKTCDRITQLLEEKQKYKKPAPVRGAGRALRPRECARGRYNAREAACARHSRRDGPGSGALANIPRG